jgi:uncharacterized Tic20 family protein
MNGTTVEVRIPQQDQTLAALTHLSGLSGYIVPLGGVIVPIVIWMVKKDAPLIAAIAKQAVFLNLMVFLLIAGTALLWLTIILIPAVVLFWCLLGLAAIALPIIGAIKASQGLFFRYPVVGSNV